MTTKDIAIIYINENNETCCHIFKQDDISDVFLRHINLANKYKQDPLNPEIQESLEWIIDECEDSENIKEPVNLTAYDVYIIMHSYLKK